MASFDEQIHEMASQEVREGFYDLDVMVERILESLDEPTEDPEAQAKVESAVRAALERHRTEQASWPESTDCDRLARSFEWLEENGVVARENFTCCRRCGSFEIGGEIEEASASRPVEGYVFFHMQDTERAAEGEGLMLAYGAVDEDDVSVVEVGRRVVAALQREGLQVEWDENPGTRIALPTFDWKRRRSFNG